MDPRGALVCWDTRPAACSMALPNPQLMSSSAQMLWQRQREGPADMVWCYDSKIRITTTAKRTNQQDLFWFHRCRDDSTPCWMETDSRRTTEPDDSCRVMWERLKHVRHVKSAARCLLLHLLLPTNTICSYYFYYCNIYYIYYYFRPLAAQKSTTKLPLLHTYFKSNQHYYMAWNKKLQIYLQRKNVLLVLNVKKVVTVIQTCLKWQLTCIIWAYKLYMVYSYILKRQVIMSYINYIILHYIHYVIFTMFIMFFV